MEIRLKELAEKINITLSENQISKFNLYKDLLKEWNEKINLTSIIEDEDIIIKHFIDSLTCVKYIKPEDSVIDIGTGAGFPGLPIKIVLENTKITLLDSLNKRLLFLNEVIEKNSLRNVELLHGRAEDFGKDLKFRELYNVATARAVANMATLAELCLPFVKVGGVFICMKGNSLEEAKEGERAIEILGGKIEKIENIILPGSDIERNLIIIRKETHAPNIYPRKAGTPEKKPLM
jgi:16S rRNA (guanine527-N7)-methyltransferase